MGVRIPPPAPERPHTAPRGPEPDSSASVAKADTGHTPPKPSGDSWQMPRRRIVLQGGGSRVNDARFPASH
jgi:hypothetical protein